MSFFIQPNGGDQKAILGGTNPLLYYHPTEGSGNILYDKSGNNLHATLVGSYTWDAISGEGNDSFAIGSPDVNSAYTCTVAEDDRLDSMPNVTFLFSLKVHGSGNTRVFEKKISQGPVSTFISGDSNIAIRRDVSSNFQYAVWTNPVPKANDDIFVGQMTEDFLGSSLKMYKWDTVGESLNLITASDSLDGSGTLDDSNSPLRIFSQTSGSAVKCPDRAYGFVLWDRILDISEMELAINALYE